MHHAHSMLTACSRSLGYTSRIPVVRNSELRLITGCMAPELSTSDNENDLDLYGSAKHHRYWALALSQIHYHDCARLVEMIPALEVHRIVASMSCLTPAPVRQTTCIFPAIYWWSGPLLHKKRQWLRSLSLPITTCNQSKSSYFRRIINHIVVTAILWLVEIFTQVMWDARRIVRKHCWSDRP